MKQNTIIMTDGLNPGEWLLLKDNKIIAHSDRVVEIIKEARKYPDGQTEIMPVLLGHASYY